jgi:serine/threonine protein kinase
VYLVRGPDGLNDAMKFLQFDGADVQKQQAIIRDIEILVHAAHPALLHVLGYSLPTETDPSAAIVTEFMSRGSLSDIISLENHGRAPRKWDLTRKLIVIFGLAGGLHYLHDNQILHGNLKGENILLTDNLEPQITDFGLTKALPSRPSIYTPPEKGTDFKGDVYAFSILAFAIFSARTPFPDAANPAELIRKGARPEIPDTIPNIYATLIQQCWAQDPDARPTFEEVVNTLNSDDFLLAGCETDSVSAYRSRVFPPRAAPSPPGMTVQELMSEIQSEIGSELAELQKMIDAVGYSQGRIELTLRELRTEAQDVQKTFEKNDRRIQTFSLDFENTGLHLQKIRDETDHFKRLAGQSSEFRRYAQGLRELYDRLLELDDRKKPSSPRSPTRRRTSDVARPPRRLMTRPSKPLPAENLCNLVPRVDVEGFSLSLTNRKNLPLVLDPTWTGAWSSRRCDDAWLSFDFREARCIVTAYVLKSAANPENSKHLRSWVLEGSVGGCWSQIHRVDDDKTLNGPGAVYSADNVTPVKAKTIRLRQIAPSHAGPGTGFSLANVQLFGSTVDP